MCNAQRRRTNCIEPSNFKLVTTAQLTSKQKKNSICFPHQEPATHKISAGSHAGPETCHHRKPKWMGITRSHAELKQLCNRAEGGQQRITLATSVMFRLLMYQPDLGSGKPGGNHCCIIEARAGLCCSTCSIFLGSCSNARICCCVIPPEAGPDAAAAAAVGAEAAGADGVEGAGRGRGGGGGRPCCCCCSCWPETPSTTKPCFPAPWSSSSPPCLDAPTVSPGGNRT
mmetsp:Transcript_16909/g.46680  ORF Transcript_16909/g.46680 Transcript_16909/m.46680 type:complete len:228 (+) Transcript_16909:123-806(+)